MSSLPEPLAALDAQYEYLISQVENQAMSVAQAAETLAAATTVDGSGAVWGMDLDGDFTRMVAGGPAVKADPSGFVTAAWPDPTQVPPTAHAPGAAGVAAAPFATPANTQGFPPPVNAPGAPPAFDTPAAYAAQANPVPAANNPWGNPYEAKVTPASNPWESQGLLNPPANEPAWAHGANQPLVSEPEPKPDRLGGVKASLKKNKIFVGVVVVGVAIVAFAVLRPSGSVDPTPDAFPTAEPTAAPTAQPTPTQEPQPQPTSQPTTPSDNTGKGPSKEAVEEVASAYASGDVLQAAAFTMDPNDLSALTRAVIVTTGVGRSGNNISPGKASFNKDSKTWSQTWVVRGESGVLFTSTVQWVNTGSAWRISKPPVWQQGQPEPKPKPAGKDKKKS